MSKSKRLEMLGSPNVELDKDEGGTKRKKEHGKTETSSSDVVGEKKINLHAPLPQVCVCMCVYERERERERERESMRVSVCVLVCVCVSVCVLLYMCARTSRLYMCHGTS